MAPPAPQVAPIRRENRLPGHLMPCGRWSGTPSACPDDGLTSKDASLVTLGATRPAGWSADGESRVTLVVKVIVPRFGHKGANRISVALQLTLWHESQFTLASLKARATALCAKGHSALATIVAPWVRWATLSAAIFKNALRASCLRRPAAERRTVSRAHSRNGAQSRGHSLEGTVSRGTVSRAHSLGGGTVVRTPLVMTDLGVVVTDCSSLFRENSGWPRRRSRPG